MPVIVTAILFAAVPMLAQTLDQPFLIRVFSRVAVFAVAAVALNLLIGYAGLVSVMHAAVLGLGGYTVAILASHAAEPMALAGLQLQGTTDLLVSAPIAVAVAALVSALLGVVALRTRGAYFIMITLAFNQMLYYLFISLDEYGGDEGLQITRPLHIGGLDVSRSTTAYYLCVASLLFVLLLASRLVRSRFGVVLRAAAGNEARVAAVGIAPTRYQLAALTLAGALAGWAGVLLAISQQFVSPADMAWTRSGELIVMVVLGGAATVWGPIAGAAIYLLLELVLSSLTIHWQLPFGVLIILMVAFMRTGVAGLATSLWRNDRV